MSTNTTFGRVEFSAIDHLSTAELMRTEPDIFSGEGNNLDEWLYQLDIFFESRALPDEAKPEYAMIFMGGRADEWVMAKHRLYVHKADPDAKKLFQDFGCFTEALQQVFGTANGNKQIAAKVIQTLRQQTSAADYTTEFQRHAGKLGWGDTTLMAMYKKGLKNTVRNQLAFHSGTIDSLDDLIEAANDIDDKINQQSSQQRIGGILPYRMKENLGTRNTKSHERGSS